MTPILISAHLNLGVRPSDLLYGKDDTSSTLGWFESELAAFTLLRFSEGQSDWKGVYCDDYINSLLSQLTNHYDGGRRFAQEGVESLQIRNLLDIRIVQAENKPTFAIFPTPELIRIILEAQREKAEKKRLAMQNA